MYNITSAELDSESKGSGSLFKVLKSKLNIPTFRAMPAYADAPERWRTSVGGFDPATPYAEALINYHNHAVTYMIFVVLTVLHAARK